MTVISLLRNVSQDAVIVGDSCFALSVQRRQNDLASGGATEHVSRDVTSAHLPMSYYSHQQQLGLDSTRQYDYDGLGSCQTRAYSSRSKCQIIYSTSATNSQKRPLRVNTLKTPCVFESDLNWRPLPSGAYERQGRRISSTLHYITCAVLSAPFFATRRRAWIMLHIMISSRCYLFCPAASVFYAVACLSQCLYLPEMLESRGVQLFLR